MMYLTATLRTDDGEAVGVIALAPKVFTTGNVGWYGTGKMAVDGVRYQAQVQIVRIKPKPEAVQPPGDGQPGG